MIRIAGLDHVVLRSRAPERLIAFYRDVLDCAVEREVPAAGLTQLRAGAALIDIVAVPEDGALAPAGTGNMDHLCLRVEPFDAARIARHMARHGVACGEVASRYGAEGVGPSIYLSDPDGNRVELKGPPDPGQGVAVPGLGPTSTGRPS